MYNIITIEPNRFVYFYTPLDDQRYRMVRVPEQVLSVQMSQVSSIVDFDFPHDVSDSQTAVAGRSGVHLKRLIILLDHFVLLRIVVIHSPNGTIFTTNI